LHSDEFSSLRHDGGGGGVGEAFAVVAAWDTEADEDGNGDGAVDGEDATAAGDG